MPTPPPVDPIAAVTHPDPYPFYAQLAARRPLYRDPSLGLWVASGARAVQDVLSSDLCHVRPRPEPVPRALAGSAAGDVFRHLVRMNDGPGHSALREAVTRTLNAVDPLHAAATSRAWADTLAVELAPLARPGALSEFCFRLPAQVMGALVGLPPATLPRTALLVDALVGCFTPGATPARIERGIAAARELVAHFHRLLGSPPSDAVVANTIGFLTQSYEATAGLIGNTLVALATRPALQARVAADAALLGPILAEVLRDDPPVQNTRRFVARDGVVAGQPMKADDTVLVVLAAASRDPTAPRDCFAFGRGAHACPGEGLSTTIARAGIERLLAGEGTLVQALPPITYRPSANTRIPRFGKESEVR